MSFTAVIHESRSSSVSAYTTTSNFIQIFQTVNITGGQMYWTTDVYDQCLIVWLEGHHYEGQQADMQDSTMYNNQSWHADQIHPKITSKV